MGRERATQEQPNVIQLPLDQHPPDLRRATHRWTTPPALAPKDTERMGYGWDEELQMRILRSRSSQLISSINYPLPEYGSKTPRRSKTQINLVAPRFPTPVRRSSLNKKSLDLYRDVETVRLRPRLLQHP